LHTSWRQKQESVPKLDKSLPNATVSRNTWIPTNTSTTNPRLARALWPEVCRESYVSTAALGGVQHCGPPITSLVTSLLPENHKHTESRKWGCQDEAFWYVATCSSSVHY
jgi:hypothetical protein